MLCRLLLMRHAKSSEAQPGMSDHERPLSEKGINDAAIMAKKIVKAEYKPRLILCSDAQRTMLTWKGMALDFPKAEFHSSPRLYNTSANNYLTVMLEHHLERKTMMVIGHNPTMENLVFMLSKEHVIIKPADLVVLENHADSWSNALSQLGHWKLEKMITP